jgi:hypothetical protein
MPVTAKLSRKFYERFGDDVANELVDWFNAVDETYRTQLREINDLNWQRFQAAMDARFAAADAGIERRLADLEVKLERRFTEQTRWMVGLWLGTVLPLGGLMVGLFTYTR